MLESVSTSWVSLTVYGMHSLVFSKGHTNIFKHGTVLKDWISSPFDERRNLLNAYFHLLTENHLCRAQHRQMNPEHFSNALKISLESTWVIKS